MSETRRPAAQRRPAPQNGRDPRRNGQPQRRGRKRRKRVTGRFIIFLVIVALLAVGGGVLFAVLRDKPDTTNNPGNTTLPVDNTGSFDTSDTSGIDVVQSSGDISALLGTQDAVIAGLKKDQMVDVTDLNITPGLDENWINVLLLGSDARTVDESSRTDTMIICSVNKSTGEAKLTSILRDTAVEFTDIGQYNGTYRINAANYFGGPELAMKTLNKCLGMNISNYVMVDFTSFSIIAEKLGGVEMTISQEEMEHINENALKQAKMARRAGIDETELEATNVWLEQYGENTHLNGRQTLAYARIRKIDSDISRAERQRKVLVALLEKLKTKSMQDIMSLAMTLSGYVTTNMNINDIIPIATTVCASGLSDVEQLRLPVNNSYVQETRREQSMLYDTDWALNSRELYNFIYD